MTLKSWVIRPVVMLVLAALVLVFLPVERVFANEVAPETKSETITGVPAERSEVLEAPEADDVPGEAEEAPAVTEEAPAETDEVAPLTDVAPGEAQDGTDEGSDAADDAPDGVLRERSEVIETPMPFTGLGFGGPGDLEPTIHWRALGEDGEWSDWQAVEILDQFDGPDPDSAEAQAAADNEPRWFSDAVWTGPSSHLQIQIEGAALDDLDITMIDTAGLSESLFAKAKRTLLSLGTEPAAEASPTQPTIIPRSQWLGSAATCDSGSINTHTVRAAVLHHTVTMNDYTQAQAPQQVRNMYHYHACTLGWADLGYNFVVDRFGNIYEGRRGGITRGVQGAHAGGWNSGTFGVAIMGNYNTANPSNAALTAAEDLIAWKFDIHGINPSATATTWLNSQTIPTLVGHRNVRGSYTRNPSTTTDCPGQNIYTRMSSIRQGIEVASGDWIPVVGDWNGNGVTTPGWFKDGQWRLRNSNSAGNPNLTFTYGAAGDLPVVGDWNGNGQTTVGIMRGSRWLLRNSNSGGAAHIEFHYGRGQIDWPMAGDWNGNGRDTPAIVRDGEWHLRNSLSGGPGEIVFYYGRVTRGDIPVVGDWTGSGVDYPGILRDGYWHLRNTHSGGPADEVFIYGRLRSGDTPIIGDWNGSGQATIGITRGGEWHLRNSLSGGSANISFTYR
jgi:hypothetical protein